MNYIVYAMIALTVMPILFGLLLGLLRGSRRALLRLILVVVSVALAFALCGVVTKAIVDIQIDAIGGSLVEVIRDFIVDRLPESVSETTATNISEYATYLAQSLLQVIVFLLLFFVAWLLTWAIAYPLCKLFVKKGKKRRRLIGMAIGAVQGVVVAFVVCIVFTGLLVQAHKVTTAVANLTDTLGEMEASNGNNEAVALADEIDDGDDGYTNTEDSANNGQPLGDIMDTYGDYLTMLDEFVQSPICKMYNAVGAKPFDWITGVKAGDKKVTLSGQVDVISNIVNDVCKLAKELNGLQNFDFSALLEDGSIENLQELFDRLDAVIKDLSDETKALIDDLVTSFAGEAGLDLGDVKLTEIDFHKEGQIIGDLYEYTKKDELTVEDADEIVEKLADSDIILGVLKNQNLDVASNLSDEQLDAVSNKIEELEKSDSLSPEKVDALRHIFGLNEPEQPEAEEASLYLLTYTFAA